MKNYYTFTEFREMMEKAGYPSNKRTFLLWEKKGIFKPKRLPHNNWRIFNDKDIREIFYEFSPNGTGKWEAK